MRADRLLRILLTLQAEGRVTAQALSERLEVSTRTIQRDMDALSGAGIPVFATRGGDGGWELIAGYRPTLSGLTANDAAAIVAGRPSRLLEELGIDVDTDAAVLKLLANLSPQARELADRARQRLYVDLAPWGSSPRPVEELQLLQRAAWDDRLVRLRYAGRQRRFRLEPYALVAKGHVWYLVGRLRQFRVYRLDRMSDIELTNSHFVRESDFNLESQWTTLCEEFTRGFSSFVVHMRVRGRSARRVRWSGFVVEMSGPDADGWHEATVDTENYDEAVSLALSLAPEVMVLRPHSLIDAIREAAQAAAFQHGANAASSNDPGLSRMRPDPTR